ncbi:PAS domain-containing protein [Thermomonospora sp. CIF 1]|uniref:PAS domain-containing protein n=1 Tax=Thermomonospora sp. CIF 1 TaxID=1916083 RepID=UPI000CBA5AF5|nr:PAS domain-containing protein [Thermomonospora sp. CIF 1]PKK16322.1 MAG: histidine kinase [Thermomonospora sp. CIF 1]
MSAPTLTESDIRSGVLGLQELFFSTTDRRGVIRQGNSVFARVSGYSLEELVGAPHNIVRHPDMPGGAFRLIWDRLQAGRAVGAYVRNQTKTGGSYWVYATISPLHDGYISVRMVPDGPMFALAKQIYAQAVEVEREAMRTHGAGRREAALVGMRTIETLLQQHGFGSYDEFMLDTLPAELSSKSHLLSLAHARPGAHGPVAEVLEGSRALDRLLGDLIGRLAQYQNLSEEFARTSAHALEIAHRLDRSVQDAQHASDVVADSAPVLANVARVMALPMHDAVNALERLQASLGRLRSDVAELRFKISLAGLYNHMAAAFAAEVVDGAAPADALSAVPLLCDASRIGVLEMSAQVQQVNDALHDIAALVREAAGLLGDFRRFLGQWRILVMRHRVGEAVRDKLQRIDAEIAASWEWMQTLNSLGQEYESAVVPFDAELLQGHLARIQATLVAA